MSNTVKYCKKCKTEKPTTDFSTCNRKHSKDGFVTNCKLCTIAYKKDWYDNNKKEILNNRKELRLNNPDLMKERKRLDYLKHKERYIERAKNSYINSYLSDPLQHRKTSCGRTRRWRNKNKHIVAWRSILREALKRLGQEKKDSTIQSLGYSSEEFRLHIESLWTTGMNWDNHGEWHIDHIVPVVTFPNDTSCRIVNALKNLRPLWATTRIIDGIIYEGNLNRPKLKKIEK